MKKWLALVVCLIPLTTFEQTTQTSTMAVASAADTAPLGLVIAQVTAALDEYQNKRGSGVDALPPLASAEFEFKTSTATSETGSINFFIFRLGGSHQNDVTSDVTFTYSLPKPPQTKSNKKPIPLKEALAQSIQHAAAAVKTAGTVGRLPFNKLVVTLQYGVTWKGDIGANVPIQFVTVGLGGERSKNTVQTVKLTFGQ